MVSTSACEGGRRQACKKHRCWGSNEKGRLELQKCGLTAAAGRQANRPQRGEETAAAGSQSGQATASPLFPGGIAATVQAPQAPLPHATRTLYNRGAA